MLATRAARSAGYDEAIMLTDLGTIADWPGQTVFAVKDGTVATPPPPARSSGDHARHRAPAAAERGYATPSAT